MLKISSTITYESCTKFLFFLFINYTLLCRRMGGGGGMAWSPSFAGAVLYAVLKKYIVYGILHT